MATEWSLDFCLACDRQTSGGPYCSQSCRLAELDLVSSDPLKPSTTTTRDVTTNPHRWNNSTIGSRAYPRNSSRVLSPSSSQTSLSSLQSNSSSKSAMSDRFQDELRDYASCFDQVRDLKRRMTSWCNFLIYLIPKGDTPYPSLRPYAICFCCLIRCKKRIRFFFYFLS